MPKISQLSALTVPDSGDELPIVDVSASTTKKITRDNLLAGAPLPADTVDTQAIGDGEVTAPKIDFGGSGSGVWWEEIGRTTLGSSGSTITINNIPNRKYLMLKCVFLATGGSPAPAIRFNNDSGNNYARRASADGGAQSTQTSVSQTSIGSANDNLMMIDIYIINIANSAKFTYGELVFGNNSAATAPSKTTYSGKWANTSNAISRIDIINTGSGSYNTGSEVVVLGHN